jgi:hypothetical protein
MGEGGRLVAGKVERHHCVIWVLRCSVASVSEILSGRLRADPGAAHRPRLARRTGAGSSQPIALFGRKASGYAKRFPKSISTARSQGAGVISDVDIAGGARGSDGMCRARSLGWQRQELLRNKRDTPPRAWGRVQASAPVGYCRPRAVAPRHLTGVGLNQIVAAGDGRRRGLTEPEEAMVPRTRATRAKRKGSARNDPYCPERDPGQGWSPASAGLARRDRLRLLNQLKYGASAVAVGAAVRAALGGRAVKGFPTRPASGRLQGSCHQCSPCLPARKSCRARSPSTWSCLLPAASARTPCRPRPHRHPRSAVKVPRHLPDQAGFRVAAIGAILASLRAKAVQHDLRPRGLAHYRRRQLEHRALAVRAAILGRAIKVP